MIKTIITSLNFIPKKFNAHKYFLVIFILLSAIIETLSIALVLPILHFFIDPEIIEKFQWVKILLINFSPLNIISETSFSSNQYIISTALLIFFALILLKSSFLLFYHYFQANLINKIFINISLEELYKNFNLKYIDFQKKDQSHYINFFMVFSRQIADSIQMSLIIFSEILLFFFLVIFIVFINKNLAFLIFSILLISSIFYIKIFKKKTNYYGTLRRNKENERLQFLNQIFNLVKEIKVSKKESFFTKVYKKILLDFSKTDKFFQVVGNIPKLWFEIISAILIFATVNFMFLLNYQPNEVIILLGIFLVILVKIVPSINKITSSLQALEYMKNTINTYAEKNENEIQKLIDINKVRESDLDVKIDSFKSLEFKNVFFSFDKEKVISNINFKFEKNIIYGISGKSGSGKTTLVNLICGLFDPKSGEIYLNEKKIKSISSTNLSLKIGYMPQEIFILNDTIKKNIAFGFDDNQINDEKVKLCLKKSKLLDFVLNLENNLNFKIKNYGKNFSGGQKQRIGIARSLYNDNEIFIFDESTSSLDKKNELEIMNTVQELSKNACIIVISHKKEILDLCDKIIDL